MKLRLSYTPEGKDPQSWVVDIEDFDNLDAESIELVGGSAWDSFGEWFQMIGRGNMRAVRALLWILMRRTDPDLDFNQIRFRTSELASEALPDEPEGKEEAGDSDTGSPPPTSD